MISAKDALVIRNNFDFKLKGALIKIDSLVKEAASAGRRSVDYIDHGSNSSCNIYDTIKETPHIKNIKAELQKLEYTVSWGKCGETYIPRGHADDDGNGPEFTNWGLTINW